MPDLDRYFARVGYQGPVAPTLDTLTALHALHPAAIPFENLDPWLRRPVRLDPAALHDKLVIGGRGGYCYEHNLLLAGVLRRIGFTVRGLAARVMWNAPADAVRPRSHMLLLVEVGGVPYLADVGFGGLTLTAPLRLEADVEQPTPHERFRLVRQDGDLVVQADVGGGWSSLYRFGHEEHLPADYDVANWYVSTHPESPFVRSLMAARAVPGCRYALLNRTLTTYRVGVEAVRQTLGSGGDVRAALESIFGIVLPSAGDFDAALDRLP
jgi:N-hydroxyarylamine O-acetyltransferase